MRSQLCGGPSESGQEGDSALTLKLLFQPAGDGLFLWACEADSFRGLVAAIIDDPDYEKADVASRLVSRLRFADDIVVIAKVNGRKLSVADRDRAETINVASDKLFIHSLDRLGLVSLVASANSKGTGRRALSS